MAVNVERAEMVHPLHDVFGGARQVQDPADHVVQPQEVVEPAVACAAGGEDTPLLNPASSIRMPCSTPFALLFLMKGRISEMSSVTCKPRQVPIVA